MLLRITREGVTLDFKPAMDFPPLVPKEQFLGKPLSSVLPPGLAALLDEMTEKAFGTGQLQTAEYELEMAGQTRSYEARLMASSEHEALLVIRDITKRKQMEDELRKSKDSLALQAEKLEALNTALKVLLDQQEQNQRLTSARLKSNMQELITPYLERLKDGQMAPMDRVSLSVLESNLMDISSDFVYNLASCYPNLTPKEIQVANLVKEGKSSGEIAHVMGVSLGTVNAHRNNLRRKMKLGKGGANLRSHLLAMK